MCVHIYTYIYICIWLCTQTNRGISVKNSLQPLAACCWKYFQVEIVIVYTCHYYHLVWQMYNHSGCDMARASEGEIYDAINCELMREGEPLWHFPHSSKFIARHLFISMVLIATLRWEWNTQSNPIGARKSFCINK